jgi:hypothetical protein
MLYPSSNATADGRFTIKSPSTRHQSHIAQVQAQNRLSVAQLRLPADAQHSA